MWGNRSATHGWKPKTSAEIAREDAENEKVDNMLDGAFGTLSGLETNKHEESLPEEVQNLEEDIYSNEKDNEQNLEPEISEEQEIIEISEKEDYDDEAGNTSNNEEIPLNTDTLAIEEEDKTPPALPPNNPMAEGSPSGPPSKGPPSGPPSKGPPSGPPSKGPPSGPPSKGPPSGPPSKGPPSGPPTDLPSENIQDEVVVETVEEASTAMEDTSVENDVNMEQEVAEEAIEAEPAEEVAEEAPSTEMKDDDSNLVQDVVEENLDMPDVMSNEEDSIEETVDIIEEQHMISELEHSEVSIELETEAEIARLSAEVERLRKSMAGAAEVIEDLENPPMPPTVMDNLVIGAHIVGDMARLARQLDREQLIRASMGTIAMLHPDQLEIIVSTKHMALLPRMDERDICAAKLGVNPPRGAPADWRVLEVVLASVSLITGGPAAVIHSHGPFTTAASCEKDLVLVQPIDEIGKKHIGKIIIVDPDDDNPEEFLRQVAEALQQGGMRCVVIRGKGAYAVGADLDQAWANAAMLEHSMKIVLLARQANLKV